MEDTAEIQDIICDTLHTVMCELENKLTELINKKLQKVDTWINTVADRTTKLEANLQALSDKLDSLGFTAATTKCETHHKIGGRRISRPASSSCKVIEKRSPCGPTIMNNPHAEIANESGVWQALKAKTPSLPWRPS